MKTAHRWLASIPCVATLVLLASATMPIDSAAEDMSVAQARKVLTELRGGSIYHDGRPSPITDVHAMSNRVMVTDNTGKQSIFKYRELPQISVSCPSSTMSLTRSFGCVALAGKDTFRASGSARQVADALNVLKQNAIGQKKEVEEYDASFAASLADHREKAASNAALPEAANRYKVQAEGAVRDKQFDDAADLYAEALKIAPWWPAGHFNRALLLGEAGDYESAKREMNHYLQLVPNAPNARAAQDRIYEWERLESRSK